MSSVNSNGDLKSIGDPPEKKVAEADAEKQPLSGVSQNLLYLTGLTLLTFLMLFDSKVIVMAKLNKEYFDFEFASLAGSRRNRMLRH